MSTTLILALVGSMLQSRWPEASLIGTYTSSSGFELLTVSLKRDRSATYSWRPDHPGGTELQGRWSFDGEVVTLRFQGLIRERKVYHEWTTVPVSWGDRRYLVAEEQIRDFAGEALRWLDGNKDLKSQASEFHRAPLMRDLHARPKRFGTPRAPGRFTPWFEWR